MMFVMSPVHMPHPEGLVGNIQSGREREDIRDEPIFVGFCEQSGVAEADRWLLIVRDQ
jgi:hypothetical protein